MRVSLSARPRDLTARVGRKDCRSPVRRHEQLTQHKGGYNGARVGLPL